MIAVMKDIVGYGSFDDGDENTQRIIGLDMKMGYIYQTS